MKKAFTLMEVNLAILIMAGGILSILGLYSLGFRENRQSTEDVISAAYADAVISPLVNALSSTNISWTAFKSLQSLPSREGWKSYFNNDGLVVNNPESIAQNVFGDVLQKMSASKVSAQWPSSASGGLKGGLVIIHDESDPAIVKISFRAARKPGEILAAPHYYTEVRFQGDPTK